MARDREVRSNIVKYPSWWQRRTLLEKILLTISILFGIAVVALGITLYLTALLHRGYLIENDVIRPEALQSRSALYVEESKPILNNVCQSSGCIHAASAILSALDTSVQPCEDFYHFSCGKFIEETSIPEEKVTVDSFSLVRDKLQEQTLTILVEDAKPDESKPFVLAKNLYQSCLNKSIIAQRGLRPLKELINSYGGWPVVIGDAWDALDSVWDWKNLIKQFRDDGFEQDQIFAFTVSTNLTNSSLRTIDFDQTDLGLNREYIIRGLEDKVVKAYYEYMVDSAVMLGADQKRAEKEMLAALEFETALANISLANEDRRNATALNNPMSIKEIQERYPYLDWLSYINSLLPSGLVVDENEIISNTVPTFFDNLGDILATTPKRVVANYLMWRVAFYTSGYMTNEQRQRKLQFLGTISGQQVEEPRWKECIAYASSSLPISVGALYVRKYFSEESRKEATDMVKNIRHEFENLVGKLSWMDNETKKAAIDKAQRLVEHIGFPNELADNAKLEEYYALLEIERDNLLLNSLRLRKFGTDFKYNRLREAVNKTDWLTHSRPAIVNAFYSPLENSIQFPAGILQNKFFNIERPRYMNYAAIGSVVGHEITHGFDDLGRQFDADGNLVEWWDESTREQFLVKAQCIIEQYGNYTEPRTNLKLNGKNTQGENIADNGGIKEAYQAYKRWALKNGNEGTLPGLDYSVEQLFFISAAQMWCAKARDQYSNLKITTDSHSPNQFRVNGPLSNLDAFSNVFNCPLGSPMNPEQKCEVW